MEKVQIRSGILKFFGPLFFTRSRSGFGLRLRFSPRRRAYSSERLSLPAMPDPHAKKDSTVFLKSCLQSGTFVQKLPDP